MHGYNIAPDEDINGTAVPSSATDHGVGLGVGLGVGIPLLAAVGILSFLLLREKKRSRPTRARHGSASSMGQIMARPSMQAESPRVERSSTKGDLLPQTRFADADAGQTRQVHELHSKDSQLVELPGHTES